MKLRTAYPFACAAVEAMNELLPESARVQVAGPAGFWRLIPVDNGDALRQLHVVLSPFGVGTWIPLLPRKLEIRFVAVDVVESIQDMAQHLGATDWPFPGAEVKARIDAGLIHVWFESPGQASTLELPPFSLSLF